MHFVGQVTACFVPQGRRKLAGGVSHRKRPNELFAPAGASDSRRVYFLRPLRGGVRVGVVPVADATG